MPYRSDLLQQVKFVALNTAVVVVAKAHNPSILHDSFLSAQGIVPAGWELAAPSLSTPAISIVKYANGVVFTAEPTKVMVRDDIPKKTPVVQDLALKYLEALPHVHYSAVGINFAGFVECASPEEWVRDRFLKRGPGNDDKLKPNAVGLRFAYSVERGMLNLSCDVGTVHRADEAKETPCLLIGGNYHIPVSETSLEEARIAISSFSERLVHFTQITDSVFGLESQSHADPQ